jgi:hypothetical protein
MVPKSDQKQKLAIIIKAVQISFAMHVLEIRYFRARMGAYLSKVFFFPVADRQKLLSKNFYVFCGPLALLAKSDQPSLVYSKMLDGIFQ